ncbi:serine hydrolase domain-containing protein [Desertibacillus haloalkaliphilus]|uniref:serine hydrolase domain-containing protein n=1 Tax=Desertibacillus haloalkaliphilus TaxID=1328930 RepID=UPI001FE9DA84|nr:serine hydrolase domain-containing protein [Desertibacillus haloalkaliphilus]
MGKIDESFLDQTVVQMTSKRNNFGAVLCVEQGDDFSWIGADGNLNEDDQYFIASVTKLYVTAIVLLLKEKGQLQLDDPISNYLSEKVIDGIHVRKGVDYSNEIKIKHLISNTSGIPDYFAYKQTNGKTVASELFKGHDRSWSFEETLTLVKELEPKFKPGQKGKVNYSDTNYQLLGRMIENITGMSIADAFRIYIFEELNLTKTYVYENVNDINLAPLHYKSKVIHIQKYISSISSEGGIVSTAKETMIFLRAFFEGCFFSERTGRRAQAMEFSLIARSILLWHWLRKVMGT